MELIFGFSGSAGDCLHYFHNVKSIAHTEICSICDGRGWNPHSDSVGDDFESLDCLACQGMGKIVVNN